MTPADRIRQANDILLRGAFHKYKRENGLLPAQPAVAANNTGRESFPLGRGAALAAPVPAWGPTPGGAQ